MAQLFLDIFRRRGLKAVKQRVRANPALLREQERSFQMMTPLMWAIHCKKPVTALWLLKNQGRHNLEITDDRGRTALHWASSHGLLVVVEKLVAAGADPVALDEWDETPLIRASSHGRTNTVAFLLQLPAVKASINAIDHPWGCTALSYASSHGHQSVVQFLLNVGADPTLPAGPNSPLDRAASRGHVAIAALLCQAMTKAE
jgi:ankyrin repeat protein